MKIVEVTFILMNLFR